jgi:hypothetical protein
LIASDTADRFHRNHGELGYAPKPDWKAAELELTKAIEIRDRIGESGYGGYEFNRAVCRVHLNRPTGDIVADFRKSARDKWVRNWKPQEDAAVSEWLQQNNISAGSLGFQ